MNKESKLNNEQRMISLRMYAEGCTQKEIKDELKDKYDVDISYSAIKWIITAKKNKPHLKHFKDAYLAKVREVPIANKRFRLDDRETIRVKLVKMLEENKLKTKSDRAEFLAVSARLNQTLNEAREEMEKKPQLISNVVMNMGELTDDQLHRRKQDIINRVRKFERGGIAGTGPDSGGVGPEDIE